MKNWLTYKRRYVGKIVSQQDSKTSSTQHNKYSQAVTLPCWNLEDRITSWYSFIAAWTHTHVSNTVKKAWSVADCNRRQRIGSCSGAWRHMWVQTTGSCSSARHMWTLTIGSCSSALVLEDTCGFKPLGNAPVCDNTCGLKPLGHALVCDDTCGLKPLGQALVRDNTCEFRPLGQALVLVGLNHWVML